MKKAMFVLDFGSAYTSKVTIDMNKPQLPVDKSFVKE